MDGLVLGFIYLEGWKAELTLMLMMYLDLPVCRYSPIQVVTTL